MNYRFLRALGLRTLNNLDCKCLPVTRDSGGQLLQETDPYVTPMSDPGRGASASASIAVKTATGVVPVLRDDYYLPSPPAGWTWSRPVLTGKETWYPLGNHGHGRWAFSAKYGPILNGTPCLYADGSVKNGAAALSNWRDSRVGPWWSNLGDIGLWLAWDANRHTDLVALGLDLYAAEETGPMPVLGSKVATLPFDWMSQPPGTWHVWDDWNAFQTHRVFLPWVNELWTVQLKSGVFDALPICIWWVKCDGSNAHGEVFVPDEVKAQWLPSNLALAADADNKRVVAAQSQYGATIPESMASKWPLAFWVVTGSGASPVWTKSDLTTIPTMMIDNGSTGRTPFMHRGHDRFYFAAPRVPYYDVSITTDSLGRKVMSDGYDPIEIQLPGPKPRQLTVTKYQIPTVWVDKNYIGKHSRWAYRNATQEVIQFGGDFRDDTHDDSYRQDMYALKPSDPSSHRQVQPYAPDANNPCISHPDECGWVWDQQNDVGYALRGMFASMGWPDGESNTFLPSKVAIYDPKLPDHRWTEMVLTPLTASSSLDATGKVPWPTFEAARHANWDATKRVISRIGDSAGTLCINRVNVDARTYDATLIGGSVNARPSDADFSNMGSLMSSEYTAMDPTTGYLYFHDWLRGDLYYVDTRATTPTVTWLLRSNCQSSSENETHLTWVTGILLMVVRMTQGRVRIYSWRPGETTFIEHAIPPATYIDQLATFIDIDGKEKAFGIGNAVIQSPPAEYYVLSF